MYGKEYRNDNRIKVCLTFVLQVVDNGQRQHK